jgi:hypothetical protein
MLGALRWNTFRRVCFQGKGVANVLMKHFSWTACNCSVSLTHTAVDSSDWQYVADLPSISLTNTVSILYQYLPFMSNLAAFLHRGEWDYWSASWFNVTIATAVRLKYRVHQDSSLSLFSGFIIITTWDCMSVPINFVLGGELLSCRVSRCWLDSITRKSSWSLAYMPCISNPGKCSYFSLEYSWLSRSLVW